MRGLSVVILLAIFPQWVLAQQQPDRTALQQAQNDVNEAQKALNVIEKQHESTQQETPEWKSAQEALTKASADLTSAEAAVQMKLDASPDFQKLTTAVASAKTELDDLRAGSEPLGSPASLKATQALQDATFAMHTTRRAALEADADWIAATQAQRDAQQAFDQLRKIVKEQTEQDPQWIAANEKLVTAKSALEDQRKRLAEQQRQQAEAARQQRIQNSRQRQQQQQRPAMGGGY